MATNEDDDDLQPNEVRSVLSLLALAMHTDYPGGAMSKTDAASIVKTAMIGDSPPHLGLPASEVRHLVPSFLEIAEDRVGILVNQGPNRLGFIHRSLQEHLAGWSLSKLPIVDQKQIFSERGSDTRWSEVLLSNLSHQQRSEDTNGRLDAQGPHGARQRH